MNADNNAQFSFEDYSQEIVPTVGTYRAFPVSWSLIPAKETQSKAIRIRWAIRSQWDQASRSWSLDWPPGYYIDSRTWVIGKTGGLNESQVKRLGDAGLWNGDPSALEGPPANVFALISVQQGTGDYSNRLEVNWISANADVPEERGAFAPSDPGLLAAFKQQFGSQTRAVIGGAVGGGGASPAPAGAPAPAPTPPATPPSIGGGQAAAPAGSPPVASPPAVGSSSAGQAADGPGQEIIPPATGEADDPSDAGKTPF